MKVLFLDFDGVLNSQPFLIEAHQEIRDLKRPDRTSEEVEPWALNTQRWVAMIDPNAVELLNEVVARTDCAVVVSSSWRIGNNRHDLQHFLELRGFRFSILGCTPSLSAQKENGIWVAKQRGHEIQAWLDEWEAKNPDDLIESFAIVDDDGDMAHLKDRLVQTSFTVGLTNEHVEQLVSLLGESA